MKGIVQILFAAGAKLVGWNLSVWQIGLWDIAMEIRITDLSEAQVLDLLEMHHQEMQQFSPPGTAHVLDLSGLSVPEIDVFAAWDGEQLLSIGALKRHQDFAEIKSMRAHPEARGKGAGRAMLNHLLAKARAQGFYEVKLETGSGSLFKAATGLYVSAGFEPCAAFAGYVEGEFNKLYSLKL